MKIKNKVIGLFRYLCNDRWGLVDRLIVSYAWWLPDELYIKIRFRAQMGVWPNLKNPQTFNEKINWLKLHNQRPEYTTMVDKLAVKEYVANIIGEEYVIPTLFVWNSPEEIEWEKLPSKFVLKTTHGGGGGGVVICHDKSSFDRQMAIVKLKASMKSVAGRAFREYPYYDVPKRIIAEQILEAPPTMEELPDYKWYCFNGEPKYCQVIQDRYSNETIDFFDVEWNHQEFYGLNPTAKPAHVTPAKPCDLETQIDIARKLSEGKEFVRVDLYSTGNKTYFGELTFFPAGGIGSFTPDEWNHKLGNTLTLHGNVSGGVRVKVDTTGGINAVEVLSHELKDYKFFCFDGKVRFFKIDFGRFIDHHANYYSPSGQLLPFGESDCPPMPEHIETIPNNLNQMIDVAEKLSIGMPFLRVDLYNVGGKIYFGEMTFFPAGGLGKFIPERSDLEIGQMLNLPSNTPNI